MTKDGNEAICNYCKNRLTQAKGYGLKKKRTKLEDETLDNLSFLKDIFKKESNFAFLAPGKKTH